MDLSLNPASTALVMIDLQKGIVSRPLAPHSGTSVVEKSVALARKLKAAGGTVVAVHVGFSKDGTDRLQQPVDAPMAAPPGGMPADFSEFVPEIAALDADVVIMKRQWGAFHGTELDLQLRRRGIDTIILSGIATNIGVEATAIEAWQHNYAVVIPEDACSTFDGALHQFVMEKMFPRLARVRSTAAILDALK